MKKSNDQQLVKEAIEFSKSIKLELENHVFKQHTDQNKIRCIEFIQRGLSLSEVSSIFKIPKSTLSGWKFRIESSNTTTPIKVVSSAAFIKEKSNFEASSNESQKFNKDLDINKLVEVHVTNVPSAEPIREENIEFKVSSNNLNLSIKNLNLVSAKELMKEYLKCLSAKEI